jgi:hypothetical protein
MSRLITLRLRTAVAGTAALGLLAAAAAAAVAPLAPAHVTNASALYSFQAITNPNDPSFDQLLGINNSGLIVGYYGSGADARHPNKGFALDHPSASASFVNENYPGAAQTQVVAVTPSGNTAGFWVDASGNNHGFIDSNGTFTTVDEPLAAGKTKTTQILGLNASGVAVGFYNDAQGNPHAFKYNQNTRSFTALTPPNADSAVATAINAQDEITGYLTHGKTTAGFLISHARYSEFDLPNSTNTQPFGINNGDEIVGSYLDTKGASHGFILTNPTSNPTYKTIDDPLGVGTTVINGVNGKGQLVGFYQNSAKDTAGFVASP